MVARHHFKASGWNPSNDPEWQYRKTLDKPERDAYDALDGLAQTFCVSEWVKAGSPKHHDIKPKTAAIDPTVEIAELLKDGMVTP